MSGSIQSTSTRSGRWSASCTRALLTVLGLTHLESGTPQCEGDHVPDGPLIFDDQNLPHEILSAAGVASRSNFMTGIVTAILQRSSNLELLRSAT